MACNKSHYLVWVADAIANYVVAILAVFILGEFGPSTPESPNFITQLYQVSGFVTKTLA